MSDKEQQMRNTQRWERRAMESMETVQKRRVQNRAVQSRRGIRGFFRKVYKYRAFLLMLLPAVIYTLIFSYYPMSGIVLAFKKYTYAGGIWGSDWNGLENFKFFSGSVEKHCVQGVIRQGKNRGRDEGKNTGVCQTAGDGRSKEADDSGNPESGSDSAVGCLPERRTILSGVYFGHL